MIAAALTIIGLIVLGVIFLCGIVFAAISLLLLLVGWANQREGRWFE